MVGAVNKTMILIIVAMAMLMEAIDTTVINTAIPVIAAHLNVNPIDLKLALISYLLSLAIFIPISGWIADKYGAKQVFIVAIAIFTLSSIWCGFTDSLAGLIIARFIQGLGGSLTMPVGRLIIMRICERHELISKMALVVMVASIGMMLGPVFGGIITTHFSWRWIFWVNVPVGLIAMILSVILLPSIPTRKVHRLDKIGFILFGLGLALLTFSFSMYSESYARDRESILTMLLALCLLVLYTGHSYKKTHPIVKIELLKIRTFRVSILGNLFARVGFGGIPFLLPLFLQINLLYNPQTSGFLLAPTALGVLLIKPLAVHILRYLGYKKLLILNTIFVGLILWLFSLIDAETSLIHIGMLTFLYGFLIALQYSGMNSLAYANLEAQDLSAATSIVSTTQQLAQSFGVAVAAIMLRIFTSSAQDIHHLEIGVFHQSFIALGIMTWLSLIIFVQLKANDGEELIRLEKISE